MKTVESALIPWVSVGIIARNEEHSIGTALESLFRQTLFAELEQRRLSAEIWCVANGCTDTTADVAGRIFEEQCLLHPQRHCFTACVLTVPEAGKINAWNLFVHQVSAPRAAYLILMDADIQFGHTATLWALCQALEQHSHAHVSVGRPVKDIARKKHLTLGERVSLATSRMTQSAPAQLTGQLYCIRAETARRIYLPGELAACEDGFIKTLVCTDFLTKESEPGRIVRARHASHIFSAYVSAGEVLRNQKRQMIGQTYVHLLVDRFLPTLPPQDRAGLGRAIRRLDEQSPGWLRRLMDEHLRRTRRFWRLFPDALVFRFRRLAPMPVAKKILHFPAALAGEAVTLAACWLALRSLRRGHRACWPDKKPPSRKPAEGPVNVPRPAMPG
ncbi:MAG: glycosyltransferase [Opitutae bacterium]|nr:glycosyltransferase [Opitutae bacterium]